MGIRQMAIPYNQNGNNFLNAIIDKMNTSIGNNSLQGNEMIIYKIN